MESQKLRRATVSGEEAWSLPCLFHFALVLACKNSIEQHQSFQNLRSYERAQKRGEDGEGMLYDRRQRQVSQYVPLHHLHCNSQAPTDMKERHGEAQPTYIGGRESVGSQLTFMGTLVCVNWSVSFWVAFGYSKCIRSVVG